MGKAWFFSLCLVLVVLSCRKKEKTSWDSNWALPLINDTLDLTNYINDSTLAVTSSGLLEVALTRTVLDLGIDDLLELPDTAIEQSFKSPITLNVPPGFSIVNEIKEHVIDLKDAELTEIRLSRGEIKFTVFNPVQEKCIFTLKLPGVKKNGIDLEQTFFVPAAAGGSPGSMLATVDLSGYSLDLTGVDGLKNNVIQSLLTVGTDPNGSFVPVSNSQEFKVKANFQNIHPDYAKGYFGNKVISGTSVFNIEQLQKVLSGKIDLPAPKFQVQMINGVNVAARATVLSLSNANAMGQIVTMSGNAMGVPVNLNQANANWSVIQPSTTNIDFNVTNSSIENYIENVGLTHQLGYKLELNPLGNVVGSTNEIFPNSRIKVKVSAQLPLAVGLDGLTLQDTFALDLNQNRNKSHVSSGKLILTASNTFPISAGIELFLLDKSGHVLHHLTSPEKVEAGTLGIPDMLTGLPKKDAELIFSLSEPVLKDLSSIKQVVVQALLNTPKSNGLVIQSSIAAGSFLAIKLKTHFLFKVSI